MPRKSFLSYLKLAYSPLSTFDFSLIKGEKIFAEILGQSNLYVICQRPILYFDNVVFNNESASMSFQIKQESNKEILECTLPLKQENITTDLTKEIIGAFGRNDKSLKCDKQPIRRVDGFHIYQENEHLIWFTPEKFLQNYWVEAIEAEIIGNIRLFTNYTVLYVGKAIKQHILKRLESHSTLLEILMKESPLTNTNATNHEIVLLFFKYYDNLLTSTFAPDEDIQEMVGMMQGEGYPHKVHVDNDVEKALIRALNPTYNKIKFKCYPESKDGLHSYNFDTISYSLSDPIALVYQNGTINGASYYVNGDHIFVNDDNSVEVLKVT
jgi:hypothetical protein